jgi:hypothetical protein
MRRLHVLGAAGALVVACALPKVEIDESLADAGQSGGTGGGGASGGSAGKGSSGKGGTGAVGGGAGAGSDEERETKCGEYCANYLENCGDFEANTYDDETDCLTTCFTSNWPLGDDLAQVNSLQCRALHATLAATAQVPHCFHSAEFPSMGSCTP